MRAKCTSGHQHLLWLLALGLLQGVSLPAEGQTKPCILFLGGHVEAKPFGQPNKYKLRQILPDARIQDKLDELGFVWTADFFSTGMTWEDLRQFNAVVMLDFPIIERHASLKDEIRAVQELLRRFVQEGGGLMLTGSTQGGMWAQERNIEEMNRFLEPYGAAVLKEQVEEKNGALRLPRPTRKSASELAWTGNVMEHPLTEGVRGLIYPTGYAQTYYAHAVQTNGDWQTLIKGSKTAATYTVALGSGREQATKKPGSVAGEPPLLAVREGGKGRLVLWPTIPSVTIIDGYHPFWGSGLTMTGRDPEHPSDGERLLFNLLQWLVEPSLGSLGGYVPEAPEEEEGEPGLRTIDWDKVEVRPGQFPAIHRGIIGMKSTLSSGAASPDEMIRAAREAGYQFAAFGEDLEALTEERLEALKQACSDASDERFQAYPGFIYHDASGNAWLVFGPTLTWPKDDWWHDREAKTIVINNMVFRGYQFLPVIMLHPNKNPELPWFQGNFKGIAVRTYEGGKLVDDATQVYRRLQSDDYKLFATVAHIVRSAAEVRAAAQGPFHQAYVPWHELADLVSALSGTTPKYKGKHVWQWTPFVSSGPLIEDFRVLNFGTSDLALDGADRYRVYVRATSDSGLKEVSILDGLRLWRRFSLSGEKEWSVTLDGFHDRQHHFIVEATDVNGGTAVSSERHTNVQEVLLVRCTDNINTYTSGKFEAVSIFPIRGLESYVDRLAGNFTCFPRIRELDETERFAVDQRLRLVSRFGYIHDHVLHHYYAPTASANWNRNDIPELALPQTALKGRVTVTLFAPWADATSVYLVDGEFSAVRDLEVPEGKILVFHTPWVEDADVFYASAKDGRGHVVCGRPGRGARFAGSLEDVEYVANLPPYGGSRAIYPLSPNLTYRGLTQRAGTSTLLIEVDLGASVLTKDETIRYRYLAVFSEMNGVPDNGFIEDVCEGLGLRGETAYTVKPIHGTVLDTKFALRLQAEGHGFAGAITAAELPLRLPVFVEGLNPRWPAGIWYKGRNRLVIPEWTMDRMHQRYSRRKEVVKEAPIFRFAVLDDGTGMLQVDTEIGDKQVFIGNLLVCDNPEVFLELDDVRKGREKITANNPTDAEAVVTIKPGPGFDLMGTFAETVTIPAGGLAAVTLGD